MCQLSHVTVEVDEHKSLALNFKLVIIIMCVGEDDFQWKQGNT